MVWPHQALLEAQTLAVRQGGPPAGRGGPVGPGAAGGRLGFDGQHLAARLVLVQGTLPSVDHPGGREGGEGGRESGSFTFS